MSNQAGRRALLGRELDTMLGQLDALSSRPAWTLSVLTEQERAYLDGLIETVDCHKCEADLSPAQLIANALTYDQLCALRAIERKATGQFFETPAFNGDHENYRDTAILAAINTKA